MINPITFNKKTDHTINVSAQAVDTTIEPEEHTVASSNNSTTSAPIQQNSTSNADQPENFPSYRVVNDQTADDNFTDPSSEENNANGASKNVSNRSKPETSKIIHISAKAPQNGLNESVKAQSGAAHPAPTSVINNSSSSNSQKLPQTGETTGYTYSALGLLLGLDVAMTAAYAEKKRKKY